MLDKSIIAYFRPLFHRVRKNAHERILHTDLALLPRVNRLKYVPGYAIIIKLPETGDFSPVPIPEAVAAKRGADGR